MRLLQSAVACVLVLAGCSTRRVALTSDAGTDAWALGSCAEALRHPQDGLPCAFRDACIEPLDPCCARVLLCEAGTLRIGPPDCDPSCQPCGSDRVCLPGTICEGVCQPCPMIEPCTGPAGWVQLERNGCPTCDFAPQPSACADPSACMGLDCYLGAACARGCTAPEDCCVNVCAEPGCPPLAPLGCQTACPPELGCMLCATAMCACTGGAWECAVACVDGAALAPSCFYP